MENSSKPIGSDPINKDEAPAPEGVTLPDLDDPLVIKDLLRAHAMAVSKRLAEAQHKNVRREEVVAADMKAVAFLAATLLGKNPAYRTPSENTADKIEARLRKAMPEILKQYGISEGEAKDPSVFLQIVLFAFTNEIHELINELRKNPESIEKDGPAKLDALLDQWTLKLTKDRCDA